jgi:hypothetical protein
MHKGPKMTVIDLKDRAKLQAELITLAHELVERTEANPADPMVSRLATRIAETSTRLNQP